MSRNFGIVTGRSALGAQPPTGPHYDANSTRVEPHPFELGSHVLFLVVFLGSIAVVGGVAFAYLSVAPQSAQYPRDVEVYRFKGH